MEDLLLPIPNFQLINRLIQDQMGETDKNTIQEKRLMVKLWWHNLMTVKEQYLIKSWLQSTMSTTYTPIIFSGWSWRNGKELSKQHPHLRTARERKTCHRCCFDWNCLNFTDWKELSKQHPHLRTARERKTCHRCCFDWNRLNFTDWWCHLQLPVQAIPSYYRDNQIQDWRRKLLCTNDQKNRFHHFGRK